ncbi:diacylglycerol kinase family protein [Nocardioides bizhenqiangii]|uniref:Diacylglycerol kinase family protein n=1 Tax=Nocardioides bizhenqiangii TaxID=3095076 RepID=A0ABZ0ZQA0_9ACTN|nr:MULTISPECIES: diacylglycerol kinase family protein [unclassified Nocardioides]MDZ5619582.1 diacylglycerol kinase family protein [Nocardioides sp. HM23]WQQ26403.1 diacylglycerol kinase family protein [Nocardioides sp. HM61]
MLDRPRQTPLIAAVACLLLFAALAVGVSAGWVMFADVDDTGRDLENWADGRGLYGVLRAIELALDAVPIAVYSVVLAVVMYAKHHRRAAILIVAVMTATFVSTQVLKWLIGRNRPEWQETVGLLDSRAFPSGHASQTTALAGVCLVLAVMLVRRANMRRLIGVGMVLLVLVACADRVLLGRHYWTDVVGGVLLGGGLVLLGVALYSPLPRSLALTSLPLPQALPLSNDLAVVLNPIKVEDVAQFQTIVEQMAVGSGWKPPRWYFTTVEDSGTGQAEQASVDGADLVIVCGGDGTVREVCAELAGTGIPVGIVPAGTGNLLARNLGIPLFIRAAIDIALNGQDRAIDMVKATGDGIDDTHFMVMAGMGFDAAIMEGVNEEIKKKVGWIAYVLSALKALMFPTMRLEVSVDGGPFSKHRARTCVVGNVGSLQGGMNLIPDAAIDDGQLDVVLLYPRRFLSWIPLVVRVLSRREKRAGESVARFTGRSVVVRASLEVPRQLDGDTIGPGKELHMECIHGRLLVRVPR